MKIRDSHDNYTWKYERLEETGNSKKNLRLQRWLLIVLVILFASLIIINTFTIEQFRITPFTNVTIIENSLSLQNQFTPLPHSGYVVYTKGCRIRDLDPLDPDIIQRFVQGAETITCDNAYYPRLIESNSTSIFVNHTSKIYYYEEYESVQCCWSSFWRTEDRDNDITLSQTCNHFQESALIDAEFIKVTCWRRKENITSSEAGKNETVYRDYFAFVPRKPQVEERCKNKTEGGQTNKLSILIVGLDSISRMNLHRQMPKTARNLKKLGAVEMLGYNKVADNTYPNLVPVLSGLSHEQFEQTCWQDHKEHFDKCPLLWKNFSNAGYRTVFAEDACSMTTFNYLKPGFLKPPTDYYLRPYCLAIENDIGNTHKLNADLCVGSTMNFANLLHYTKKVCTTFARDRYFALFWQSSLTHDFFDFPQFGDEEYDNFLSYVDKNNLLANTALIFMSDHGIRWGSFRQTFQGKIEESLPFVFLVLPDWWKATFPEAYGNLVRNTRSLTTPFDLHETLVDLLDTSRLREESLRKRRKWLSEETIPRGISWFLPIPDHRNCEMAGIPEHYCTCHKVNNVSLDDPMVEKSSQFLLYEINRMLKKYPQCATLKPEKIIDAKMLNEELDESNKTSWVDYTITLQAIPSSAIFEGTVRHRHESNMTLVGSISRLNSYGKQSACIDDFHMRLYCYCL